jgi:UDP-2,3-diacylglucosamine pyrophosphatase LpxH
MESHRGVFRDGEPIGPTEVRVIEVGGPYRGKKSWSLVVEDVLGKRFVINIWRTHDWETWWRPGWRYIIEGGRVRRGDEEGDVTVSSSSAPRLRAQYPDDTTTFLALSDSHIGREQRASDLGGPHRAARRFLTGLAYARRYDVDAVLFGGDLFDENWVPTDVDMTKAAFDLLGREGIPFYYVLGNHGTAKSRELFRSIEHTEVQHLDRAGVQVGNVELFGVDHATEEEVSPGDFQQSTTNAWSLLMLHHDLAVRDSGGMAVSRFHDPPESEFELILSGHIHRPSRHEVEGTPIQYLGSTAELAAAQSADDGSAWLVRVSGDSVSTERLSLIE